MYNTKFKTVQDYVSSAINMTQEDQTFAAKSHQKEALGELNSGYQMLRDNNFQFSIDSLSREDYFAIPL